MYYVFLSAVVVAVFFPKIGSVWRISAIVAKEDIGTAPFFGDIESTISSCE